MYDWKPDPERTGWHSLARVSDEHELGVGYGVFGPPGSKPCWKAFVLRTDPEDRQADPRYHAARPTTSFATLEEARAYAEAVYVEGPTGQDYGPGDERRTEARARVHRTLAEWDANDLHQEKEEGPTPERSTIADQMLAEARARQRASSAECGADELHQENSQGRKR